MLDRIDLHIQVPALPYPELRGKENCTGSAEIRERVVPARAMESLTLKDPPASGGRWVDGDASLPAVSTVAAAYFKPTVFNSSRKRWSERRFSIEGWTFRKIR